LLTVGVEVELPQTQAQNLSADQEPLTVTIQADGTVFIQETETPIEELEARLIAVAQQGYGERIFIRGDGAAPYANVIDVMSRIKNAGFTNMGLVTDPTIQAVPQAAPAPAD
jgi:biopolymer transport protein TolR